MRKQEKKQKKTYFFTKIFANYLSNFAVFNPAVECETRKKVLF